MRRRAAVVMAVSGIIGAAAAVPATTVAAPPGDVCGTIVGPRWTAPGHRSGRHWSVAESGTSCAVAKFDVKRMLRERPDRRGKLRPISPFLGCSVDVRHKKIHPYGTGECEGDRIALSWGIDH